MVLLKEEHPIPIYMPSVVTNGQTLWRGFMMRSLYVSKKSEMQFILL